MVDNKHIEDLSSVVDQNVWLSSQIDFPSLNKAEQGLERHKIPVIGGTPKVFSYITANERMFNDGDYLLDRQYCQCKGQEEAQMCGTSCLCTNSIMSSQSLYKGANFECGTGCRCKFMECGNRQLQKGVFLDCLQVQFINPQKGFGLFTTKPLPMNTFVCEYIGQVFLSQEDIYYQKLKQIFPSFVNYSMQVREQDILQCIINSYEKGNISRFINHGCNEKANLRLDLVRVHHAIPQVAMVTQRDIAAGEELAFDYGLSEFKEQKQCLCGILIVNGYSSNYNGQKKFNEFVAAIKEIFKSQRQSLIDEPEIVIRDRTNLEDYLHEPSSKFQNQEAEKMFNYLDFVFVDGEGSLLPWQRKCEKLKTLFRMCKKTNKCLLAAGFGMQMLVYYCATNMADIQVINGNEKGGHLSGIKDVNARVLPQLQKDQVYLDNLTGDYYYYEQQSNDWKPHGNVGLHYQRAMASLGGKIGGDLIKKVATYESKNNYNKPLLFFSKLSDVKCNVKKIHTSHWLMQGLPQEFIVENRNSWDPHPVNITDLNAVQTNYDTFATSERGPQVAIHLNTVVLQFHIDKKYKESIQLLSNFIKQKLCAIQSSNKIDMTLDEAYLKQRQLTFRIQSDKEPSLNHFASSTQTGRSNFNNSNEYSSSQTKFNLAKTRPMSSASSFGFTKDFKHSGLGYSKRRRAVIVDNNAVSQQTIPAATVKEQRKVLSQRTSAGIGCKQERSQLVFTNENFTNCSSRQSDDARLQRSHRIPSASINSRNDTSQGKFCTSQIQSDFQKLRPQTAAMNRQTYDQHFQKQQPRVSFAQSPYIQENEVQTINNRSVQSNSNQSSGFIQQSGELTTLKHLRNYEIEKQFKKQLKEDADKLWKNQKEIRQMLHPTLCQEFLPDERAMTTQKGLLSASKSQNQFQVMKKNSSIIDQTPSGSIYKRYQEFNRLPKYSMEVPVIRNASPYIGGEEEQIRKREAQNKNKWIAPADFKTSFGKRTTHNANNFIKNYVTADPSQPPMLNKFREENKGKWVNGPFKH